MFLSVVSTWDGKGTRCEHYFSGWANDRCNDSATYLLSTMRGDKAYCKDHGLRHALVARLTHDSSYELVEVK